MKSTITEIIKDFKQGKMIILLDDENRENEGDLIMSAAKVSASDINFMATYAKGLICLTLTTERCQQLGLRLMVKDNKESSTTNFTTSIDASHGITTGISAADRAKTILDAVKKNANSEDIVQPGHIFPLMERKGGVLVRAGHTEAGCDLARMAGLEPAAVIIEILNHDGTMARKNDLEIFAKKHNIKWGTIDDLIRYCIKNKKTIKRLNKILFSSTYGNFNKISFVDTIYNKTYTALVKGNITNITNVRVHMENNEIDVLGKKSKSLSVEKALHYIADNNGIFILLKRKDNIIKDDFKTYGIGAQILLDLGVTNINILCTKQNTDNKFIGLKGFGLSINKYIEL